MRGPLQDLSLQINQVMKDNDFQDQSHPGGGYSVCNEVFVLRLAAKANDCDVILTCGIS